MKCYSTCMILYNALKHIFNASIRIFFFLNNKLCVFFALLFPFSFFQLDSIKHGDAFVCTIHDISRRNSALNYRYFHGISNDHYAFYWWAFFPFNFVFLFWIKLFFFLFTLTSFQFALSSRKWAHKIHSPTSIFHFQRYVNGGERKKRFSSLDLKSDLPFIKKKLWTNKWINRPCVVFVSSNDQKLTTAADSVSFMSVVEKREDKPSDRDETRDRRRAYRWSASQFCLCATLNVLCCFAIHVYTV